MSLESSMIVNPFGNKENPKPFTKGSQDVADVKTNDDGSLIAAFKMYSPDKFECGKLPALDPPQIDLVLQMIIANYDKEIVESWQTGSFISSLVRQSYLEKGNHEFILATGDYQIEKLPGKLKDAPKMKLKILGNCGSKAAYAMKRSRVKIEGDVGMHFGESSQGSIFVIRGDVQGWCGDVARKCRFVIHGDAGEYLGSNSLESTYIVHGDIGERFLSEAYKCILKTPNKATYQKIMDNFDIDFTATYQLIKKDGTVIKQVRT